MKLKEKVIGAISILVISVVFLMFGYFSKKESEGDFEEVFTYDVNAISTNNEEIKGNSEEIVLKDKGLIVVDIKGAVKNPREYELKEGDRIRDLIDAAGGLTEEADEERIKFSQILQDEDCIKIYKIGEEGAEEDIFSETEAASNNGYSTSGKLNLNKASSTELQTLPGIGEVKAQSIIEYRESVGTIKSVDELTNITGIGPKTVEKLRDMVDIK